VPVHDPTGSCVQPEDGGHADAGAVNSMTHPPVGLKMYRPHWPPLQASCPLAKATVQMQDKLAPALVSACDPEKTEHFGPAYLHAVPGFVMSNTAE
jgi:hypothetical protein